MGYNGSDSEPFIVEKNREEQKRGKSSPAQAEQEPNPAPPEIGPYNRALGEIYQRLYPEIRRPKPNQEAIASALQAMQRLTMESDSEPAAERAVGSSAETNSCPNCGHANKLGNRFCGGCGAGLDGSIADIPRTSRPITEEPISNLSHREPISEVSGIAEHDFHQESTTGNHYYHHHYHHHYFESASEPATNPRSVSRESTREADRLRVAAAAKGEHMSRDEAAVRRLTQEWVLACNTRQLEELIELYSTDALVLRSNLPPIRGAASVREFFFASLEAGLGEVALDPVRVEISGDLAHEVGRYTALVPGTAGKRREERGKYLWVFERQSEGEWKLVSECWCSDLTLTVTESEVPKSGVLISKTPKK